MALTHDFNNYYYALVLHGESNIEAYISEIEKSLTNAVGYQIEEIVKKEKYLIKFAHGYEADLLPKRGNKKSVDMRDMKSLDLEDDEGLFFDAYVLLSFKKEHIHCIGGAVGIISVLKGGKPVSSMYLDSFFQNLFKITNQVFNAIPIVYKDRDKYLEKGISRINSISFKVAGANMQRQVGVSSEDGMNQLYRIKDEIGGDDFTLTISGRNGLKREGVKGFIDKNSHLFKKSKATVDVLDNMGNKIQQQLDEIRFKSSINLNVDNREIIYDEVKQRMLDNYETMLVEICKEYSVKAK